MKETKHTPGPLCALPRADGNYEITNADGDVLATVYGQDGDPECWPVRANAEMFAAAPDLLAALKCIAEFGEAEGSPFALSVAKTAQAAISKAEPKC